MHEPVQLAIFTELAEREPTHALVEQTDLVVIRYGDEVSVLYGRCLHRGALLADGHIEGHNLICGLHNWDYRMDTGVSEYEPKEKLQKFPASIHEGYVYIDRADVIAFEEIIPPRFHRKEYLGSYADTHPEPEEPYSLYIKELAQHGLENYGHHGPTAAMGVSRTQLPGWDDIQLLPAQMARKPLLDDHQVDTRTVIGPNAQKPLVLDIPIFVSDMSFGSLSKESKTALAMGAELAGTGICSGEGGMLPDEQANNSRYFYELASAQFGFGWEKVGLSQAFHFKGGQGAKVGTGGHLPGNKVTPEISSVRNIPVGTAAISPSTFTDLSSVEDFRRFGEEVRKVSGGIPVGFKLAASHIEADIDFALDAGADYIILDGRGGGTGAAPTILRDHICVPTIPALRRARIHLDKRGATGVSLVITGGLRVPQDFVKAMAMGADAIAVANSAIQAIGCLGMRACNTNNCPVGIATQKPHLRARLNIETSAKQLHNFLHASTELMQVVARACGHQSLSAFNMEDVTTFHYDMARLTGIRYAGVGLG
ncbi:MAG: glutamate synthase-related protein [Bacteroidota bacterium]